MIYNRHAVYSTHTYSSIKRIIEEVGTDKYFLIQWNDKGRTANCQVAGQEGPFETLPGWLEIS